MKIWLFAVPIIFILLVAGCIGSDSKDGASAADEQIYEEKDEEVEESSSHPNFEALISSSDLSSYSITYNMKTVSHGTTVESVLKQAVSGNKFKIEVQSGETVSTTYIMDNNYYICGNSGSQSFCYEMGEIESNPNNVEQLKESALDFADKISYDGTQKIMGRTTHCYKTEDASAEQRWCLDSATGMMLGIYTTSSGVATSMEAVAFSASAPSASEFMLPIEPQKMPSYGI